MYNYSHYKPFPQDLAEKPTMEFLYNLLIVFVNGQRAGSIQNHAFEEFKEAEKVR